MITLNRHAFNREKLGNFVAIKPGTTIYRVHLTYKDGDQHYARGAYLTATPAYQVACGFVDHHEDIDTVEIHEMVVTAAQVAA